MASTAAPSAAFLSPRPVHRAAAMAAASVTRTSSRARFRSECCGVWRAMGVLVFLSVGRRGEPSPDAPDSKPKLLVPESRLSSAVYAFRCFFDRYERYGAMNVVYLLTAITGLDRLPKADAKRIMEALEQVALSHPQRMSFVTEMLGQRGDWRLRKGNYRAVYRITEAAIIVHEIGPRKEVYR
jgi:mRNA interferase RelE/StbE